MKLTVPMEVEVDARDVSNVLKAVAGLLRTTGAWPLAGEDSAMKVNGNHVAALESAWRKLPQDVQRGFGFVSS